VPTNNRADNLRWLSGARNAQHSNNLAVESIAPDGTVTRYASMKEAADANGAASGDIGRVCAA